MMKAICYLLLLVVWWPVTIRGENLVPVTPIDEGGCREVLWKKLVDGGSEPEFWMIVIPIDREKGEYSLSFDFVKLENGGNEKVRNILKVSRARSRIYNDEEPPVQVGARKVSKHRDNVEVVELSMELENSFATQLLSIWLDVLQETRYADDSEELRLGDIVQFGGGFKFGETMGPKKGLAKELSDLGSNLVDLVCSKPSERGELLKECKQQANLLRQMLDRRQR